MSEQHPAEEHVGDDAIRCTLSLFLNGQLQRIPALEAERDQLRAEVKALREANSTFATAAILPDDKVIVDKAEVDALRADAERYRWLRSENQMVAGPCAYGPWMGPPMFNYELDSAIDAARKQQ